MHWAQGRGYWDLRLGREAERLHAWAWREPFFREPLAAIWLSEAGGWWALSQDRALWRWLVPNYVRQVEPP